MADIPSAERYVAGQLDDEETARFEAAMIERPDLAADVGVRQRIRAGLALLEQRDELAALLRQDAAPVRRNRWALAAAVAALAASGTWFSYRFATSASAGALLAPDALAGRTESSTYTFAATRSQPEATRITVSGESGLLRVRLLSAQLRGEVRVTLERKQPGGADEAVGEPIAVRASEAGTIDAYLDPGKLAPGDYELEAADAAKIERFEFTLDVTAATPAR